MTYSIHGAHWFQLSTRTSMQLQFEQVFRLPDHPTAAPSHHADSGVLAAFVPGYGGGSATVLHRLPYQGPFKGHSRATIIHPCGEDQGLFCRVGIAHQCA
jgi:hypothetical protein